MAKSKFEKDEEKQDTKLPKLPQKSSEDLASDIILAISHELHVRVGIGPIWRQLNSARKKEILDTWTHKTITLLNEHR